MTATAAVSSPRSRLARFGWPVAIAVVLVASAAFNFALMFVASRDPAFAIEPDYYAKGVQWDSAMAQERHNQTLGWTATARIALGTAAEAGVLEVTLRTAEGEPVTGAAVSAEAMHNARAAQRHHAALAEREPGTYQGPLAAQRPGEWEVRLVAEREGRRFTTRARLTALAPAAADSGRSPSGGRLEHPALNAR
jgi:nitrogen fixation protein FixH